MFIDEILHQDLISFIEKCEKADENGNVNLSDYILAAILRKIIDGDCRMTDTATDHEKGKMYIELTFYGKDK